MRRGQGLHAQTREKGAQFQRSRRGPGRAQRLGEGIARGAAVVARPPARQAPRWAWPSAWSYPLHHKLAAVVVAVPAAGCAIIAFGVVAYFLDDGDLKFVLAWLRRAMAKLRS